MSVALPDLKQQLNTVLIDARACTANFQTAVFDLGTYSPQGLVSVDVVCGVGVGTNPTIDVITLHSATNNVSNAVNLPLWSTSNGSGVTNITRVSNTNSLQTMQIDPRQANRYIFFTTNVTGSGANIPMSITARMVKQVQP